MTDRLPGLKFLAFVVACTAAAIWIASITGNFRRIPFIEPVNGFEAVLDEASGLAVGDDVRLAGVAVGRVNRITLDRGDAVVAFTVRPDVEITDTWETSARWRNVIGQRYLYLYAVDGGTPLENGARIPIERSRAVADIGRFFNEITPLLEALDAEEQNRLIDALNTTLVGREQTVNNLITNFSSLATTLADQEPEIRRVITNASRLLSEYNEREDELTGFIDQLGLASDTLAARNDELVDAVTAIADVQAELGALIDANDDGLDAAVADLDRIVGSIGDQRVDFENALASTRQGLAVYTLISRFGQWFNVRGVVAQVQNNGVILYCQTEGGQSCAYPNGTNAASVAGPQAESSASADAVVPQVPLSLAPQRIDALAAVLAGPLGYNVGNRTIDVADLPAAAEPSAVQQAEPSAVQQAEPSAVQQAEPSAVQQAEPGS